MRREHSHARKRETALLVRSCRAAGSLCRKCFETIEYICQLGRMHRLGELMREQLGCCVVFGSEDDSTSHVSHVTSMLDDARSGLIASAIPTRRHSDSQQSQQVNNKAS